MNYKEWLENELSLAKKAESADGGDNDDPALHWALSVLDAAEELALTFMDQSHSGASAHATIQIFNKLADWKPITPLTGEDSEWKGLDELTGDESGSFQNKRDFGLFKRFEDGKFIGYSYNYSHVIVNEDDIWDLEKGYATSPGYIPDNCDGANKYFYKKRELKKEIDSKITFPFVPHTEYYKWDFEAEEFVKV